ncbi:MAG: cation diffusion facilitator family transporter [Solirubrobacterales bacterium]
MRLAHRARLLSWFSLVYMGLEGGVAILAGVLAGSIALIGFGIDSAIEGFASLVIVWRFTGSRLLSAHAERRAQLLVAIQFFLLAPYIGYEALDSLIAGERPEASWLGIGLSATSLAVMPLLGRAKQRIGERIGSVATKGEGQQNMLCAYLSAALLVGLGGNAVFGIWWLDPAAALVIAAVAVREGVEAWRGEGCCAPGFEESTPEPRLAEGRRADDSCERD